MHSKKNRRDHLSIRSFFLFFCLWGAGFLFHGVPVSSSSGQDDDHFRAQMGAFRVNEILSVLNLQPDENARVFFGALTRLAVQSQLPDPLKIYLYERGLFISKTTKESKDKSEINTLAENFFGQINHLIGLGFNIKHVYDNGLHDAEQKEKFDAYMRALIDLSKTKNVLFNTIQKEDIENHSAVRIANHLANLELYLSPDNRKAGKLFEENFKNVKEANQEEINICRKKGHDIPDTISHLMAYHFTKGTGESAVRAARHLFDGMGALRAMNAPYFPYFQDIRNNDFSTLIDHLDNPHPIILLIHQGTDLTEGNIDAATAFWAERNEALKPLPDGFCPTYQSVQGVQDQSIQATAEEMRWAVAFLAAHDHPGYENILTRLCIINRKRVNQLPKTGQELNNLLSQFCITPHASGESVTK